MPDNDLLCSLHTLSLIVFARDRRFRFRKLSVGCGVGNIALEALYIYVRVSATVWNPEPGASAAFRWTGREFCWNFVRGESFPWRAVMLLARPLANKACKHLLCECGEDYQIVHCHST
jgi:hypothetical protein